MRELYRLVLVDTPLAPYFSECITSEDLDDMNIEIMRKTLYKAYLEDFYRFFQAESTYATNESVLRVALDHGKASGVIKSHDRVVICQKVGDASVVKIIELEDWC